MKRLTAVASLPARAALHVLALGLVLAATLAGAWHPPLYNADRIDQHLRPAGSPVALADQRVLPTISPDRARSSEGSLLQVSRMLQRVHAPMFPFAHTLSEGELIGDVAARYGVDPLSLFWANRLDQMPFVPAGMELRIPPRPGVVHTVQEGETVAALAQAYHVAPEAIVLFKPNGVRVDRPLPVGREIFIPGGVRPLDDQLVARFGDAASIGELRAVAAGRVRADRTNVRGGPGTVYPSTGKLDSHSLLEAVGRYGDWVRVRSGATVDGWVRRDLLDLPEGLFERLPETNDFPPPPPRWVWPAYGRLTSPFGMRTVPFRSFHNGIDIANRAWTPIVAASGGRVVEAGWCSGYGYCVKIDHGEGVRTIYGHLIDQPIVSAGETVTAGQEIGYMGSTYDARGGGYSTGVHLHFTITINGEAVDPLKILP